MPVTILNTGTFNGGGTSATAGLAPATAAAPGPSAAGSVTAGLAPATAAGLSVTSGVPLQPAVNTAYFGAYPGGGNADPATSYEPNILASSRKLGCWYRYYVVTQTGLPSANDISVSSAGRVLVMSLATAYNVPTGGCGRNLTVASGSNGVALSSFTGSGVLNVNAAPSSNGYVATGAMTLDIVLSGGTTATVTYTGISGSTFTGCTTTAGSGTLVTGNNLATQYSWAASANGAYDAKITAFASNATSLTKPWFLVWSHEPDVTASQFGTAAEFVSSFQHVATLVRGICGSGNSAGNVAMAWITSNFNTSATGAYYPGDAYTDWIGVDPYDSNNTKGGASGTYGPTVTWLNTDPLAIGGGAAVNGGGGHGKPLGIFETGLNGPGVSDANMATWVSGLVTYLSGASTTWGSQWQLWMWWNSGSATIAYATYPLTIAAMKTAGLTTYFGATA